MDTHQGKTLAKEIGISTSGISKRIRNLRKYGYNIIEAQIGYRLAGEQTFRYHGSLVKVLHTMFLGKEK